MDIKTIIISNIFVSTISAVVLFLMWKQAREHYKGIVRWAFSYLFNTVGLILITLRGLTSDYFTVVLSNGLLVWGLLLLYEGLREYYNYSARQLHNYLILSIFIVIHWQYGLITPNLTIRILNLSLGIMAICLQCIWLLMQREPRKENGKYPMAMMTMVGYGVVSITRIVAHLTGMVDKEDFYQSNAIEAAVLFSYQMLYILTTYSLVLMITRRLGRERAEQEIKYSVAFHTAPYAMLLIRLKDGLIIEANQSLAKISGYSLKEAIGKSTEELMLWPCPRDRASFLEMLSRQGRIEGVELTFIRRDGSELIGLVSAEIVNMGAENYILATIADITMIHDNQRQIQKQLSDLEAMNKAMLDREDRIRELKAKMKNLTMDSGQTQEPGRS